MERRLAQRMLPEGSETALLAERKADRHEAKLPVRVNQRHRNRRPVKGHIPADQGGPVGQQNARILTGTDAMLGRNIRAGSVLNCSILEATWCETLQKLEYQARKSGRT